MVAVRFRDYSSAQQYFEHKTIELFEEMFKGQLAFTYLISKGRRTTDAQIYVTDTTQPLRHDLVARLKEEGRTVTLGIKTENMSIEETVKQIKGEC